MREASFSPYDLTLVKPSFDADLTDLIIELEHLRKKRLGGSTHPQVFFSTQAFVSHLRKHRFSKN